MFSCFFDYLFHFFQRTLWCCFCFFWYVVGMHRLLWKLWCLFVSFGGVFFFHVNGNARIIIKIDYIYYVLFCEHAFAKCHMLSEQYLSILLHFFTKYSFITIFIALFALFNTIIEILYICTLWIDYYCDPDKFFINFLYSENDSENDNETNENQDNVNENHREIVYTIIQNANENNQNNQNNNDNNDNMTQHHNAQNSFYHSPRTIYLFIS